MHFPFFRTHFGDTQLHPVSAGRSPTTHVGGVGDGVGEILGDGIGVGVGRANGVGVGVGLGVDDVSRSHTDNMGLTEELLATEVTDGFVKVGTESPPCIIATVPVGETYTMFEFAELAVEGVHPLSQK